MLADAVLLHDGSPLGARPATPYFKIPGQSVDSPFDLPGTVGQRTVDVRRSVFRGTAGVGLFSISVRLEIPLGERDGINF